MSEAATAPIAALIRDAFEDYHARFAEITRRAKTRFETRDWAAARTDAVQRIELYDQCIAECALRLQGALLGRAHDYALWSAVRDAYARMIADLIDRELYKTFYNTLTRRFFRTQGVDPAIEFIAMDIEPTDAITHPVARHSYAVSEHAEETFARVLSDYGFDVPYEDRARCAKRLAQRLQEDLAHWGGHPLRSIELLDTVFYRERRAYLIGRVFGEHRFSPCVIALVNADGALRAEAVLTHRADVAHLFGYSRSYFHADLATVGDAVVFLRTILPSKPIDELYTVLGRAKQGKTERFRTFFRHFAQHPDERLDAAEGTRGMVMAVFTLPSYPLVFKVIRDRFAEPKQMSRQDVQDKYAQVFHLDRVGRLLDSQLYRHLRFPRARFAPEPLRELLEGCADSVVADGDDVIVRLCYVQRRLRPLNLALREQAPEDGLREALDYGQAIKDMARNNIFPGDMLLKNFGVSRTGRVVFYDYDELCLVTDCRFRHWPEPTCYEEEIADEPWFHVGAHDVFPERFPHFLGLPATMTAPFREAHGELFDADWWNALQARLRAGDYPDTPPYPDAARLG